MARKLTLKKKLLFMLFSLCLVGFFSLILGEIAMRIVAPQDMNGTFRVADEVGLHVHRSGIKTKHQKGERIIYYQFREDGLREFGATPGDKRILVLGDSFTFGWLLDGKDTYVAHLQRKVEEEFGPGKVELLNGAHGGWGASDYVRYYEEYGESYDLSAVIVFLNLFDVERSLNRSQYGMNAEMTALNKRYGVRQDSTLKKVLNATPGYNWMCENCHLLQALRRAMIPGPPQQAVLPAKKEDNRPEEVKQAADMRVETYMSLLFAHLKQMTDDRGHRLLVLTTGYHWADELEGKSTRRFIHLARRVLDKLEIELKDISKDFKATVDASDQPFGITGDGHPNEFGARVIADLNWPHVKKLAEQCLENSDS